MMSTAKEKERQDFHRATLQTRGEKWKRGDNVRNKKNTGSHEQKATHWTVLNISPILSKKDITSTSVGYCQDAHGSVLFTGKCSHLANLFFKSIQLWLVDCTVCLFLYSSSSSLFHNLNKYFLFREYLNRRLNLKFCNKGRILPTLLRKDDALWQLRKCCPKQTTVFTCFMASFH